VPTQWLGKKKFFSLRDKIEWPLSCVPKVQLGGHLIVNKSKNEKKVFSPWNIILDGHLIGSNWVPIRLIII